MCPYYLDPCGLSQLRKSFLPDVSSYVLNPNRAFVVLATSLKLSRTSGEVLHFTGLAVLIACDSQVSMELIRCRMSLGWLVETGGIEPPTSCLQSRRSPD
jgi:hypothetical protein